MNLNELIEKCRENDRKAQFELYKTLYGSLMSICCRYKKNKEDAEEILNIGFLKILSNLEKYKSETSFNAWCKRIVVNTIIDEYRKDKKNLENLELTDFSDAKNNLHQVNWNEIEDVFSAEEVEQMLQILPEMSKKVFNLFAIDGYSHKEIADLFGISEGTSKWHVSFAREKLKLVLAQKLEQQRIKK
jgi:RNA polymerase sigma factor (sigma-70 family)